jgi:hypothetical protein
MLTAFAVILKKSAHVQAEGELRVREYETDLSKHKVLNPVSNPVSRLGSD